MVQGKRQVADRVVAEPFVKGQNCRETAGVVAARQHLSCQLILPEQAHLAQIVGGQEEVEIEIRPESGVAGTVVAIPFVTVEINGVYFLPVAQVAIGVEEKRWFENGSRGQQTDPVGINQRDEFLQRFDRLSRGMDPPQRLQFLEHRIRTGKIRENAEFPVGKELPADEVNGIGQQFFFASFDNRHQVKDRQISFFFQRFPIKIQVILLQSMRL